MGQVIAERRAANEELPEYRQVQVEMDKWKKNPKYQDVRNPYLGYNANAMQDLADVVGIHNMGIKFNPTFNSKEAAEEWLEAQLRKAYQRGDNKAIEKLEKYRITLEDMDRDEGTIPNVVVYSDYDNRRIKAVDGFSVVPRSKKEALRAEYDIYPTRQLRQDNLDKETRKKYKQYFRKYPNPASWKHHNFDEFVPDVSLLNRLRKTYVEDYYKNFGFTIHSKNNPTGQLSVTHYMTIIQKIMGEIMRACWLVVVPNLPIDYDFKKDNYKIKTKARKNNLAKVLQQPITPEQKVRLKQLYNDSDLTFKDGVRLEESICVLILYLYFIEGSDKTVDFGGGDVPVSLIFNLIDEINYKSGEDNLVITNKSLLGSTGYYKYTIEDKTLTKVAPAKILRKPGTEFAKLERKPRMPTFRAKASSYQPNMMFQSPIPTAPLDFASAFTASVSSEGGPTSTPFPERGELGKKKLGLEKESGEDD
jgi:hypothetical protein